MRYLSFHIENFKGIKSTEISLDTIGGASVFAFVGLNESGKTTILEAIHSFSPDAATSELLGGNEESGIPYRERVPRHLISEFSGRVSVSATVEVTDEDRAAIIKDVLTDHSLVLDPTSVPNKITFKKYQVYEDGDFRSDHFECDAEVRIKGKGQRKWRESNAVETAHVLDNMFYYTPDISYFPTFIFDFPERIYLTNHKSAIDRFYRRVFQDILDFDGRGHTIDKDIIRRIREPELRVSWSKFLSIFRGRDEYAKIQHVIDRASAVVTRVVFGRWNTIFREQSGQKQIEISFDTTEGFAKNSAGQLLSTNDHNFYVKFQVKDGTRRFAVNDRSLGFRWFFAFMLFTQFRIVRSSKRPVLFLFDEPAANLHASAQQKLIECFPEIARDGHVLVYTTHSHYMIEPKWLEQTFIVTNRGDAPAASSVIDAASLDDESLDVKCSSYRSFVNKHPNQTDYFQPILDRLEVVPSRFDYRKSSVVLEGKSDYYILRYAAKMLGRGDLALIPGLGASTFGSLVALSAGWNLKFLFVLDADRQGRLEKSRYVSEFAMPESNFATIDEFANGVNVIEDLLDSAAKEAIKVELSLQVEPNKNQIRRFFQERLASDRIDTLSPAFASAAEAVLRGIEAKMSPP